MSSAFGNGMVSCAAYVGAAIMAKKKAAGIDVPPKLSEGEQDLVWHMEHGYRLETDSLGGNPVLRRLKDKEVIRPTSANRNTIKALEKRGLIAPGSSRASPKIIWRLDKSKGI